MADQEEFDFWYALKHTRVVLLPTSRLETFGNTAVQYHLVSELMDAVGQVRVREGRVTAFRPQIISPSQLAETFLEGFGQDAEAYAAWLREHEQDLGILRYGFVIKKEESSSEVVSGHLEEIAERVQQRVKDADDGLSAVVVGVEKPWEVCLLKMMVDVTQRSFVHNWQALQQQAAREEQDRKGGVQARVEQAFRGAMEDPALIQSLGSTLQELGLFEEYQDRFFDLVKKHHR